MKTILLAASLFLFPGCALVPGIAVGAGIVYATDEDTAEVLVEVNGAAAFAASREEVLLRGTIESSDEAKGAIEARIGTSTVKMTVLEGRRGDGSLVTVKARTNGGLAPDMETARILAVAVVRRTR